MTWRRDCRRFRGDEPCAPHKQSGVLCAACGDYEPVGRRVVIVKQNAPGDVLRTTSILRGLRAKLGACHVTWVAAEGAAPLLRENPLVDRIVVAGEHVPLPLATEEFDLALNLDAAQASCALASALQAKERRGFALGPDFKPVPLHPEAETWFEMGLRDDLKRANRRTYQDLTCEIAGVRPADARPILELTPDERAAARRFLARAGADLERPLLGVNTGAGGRWPLKKWTAEGFRQLIERVTQETGTRVLLLGGPLEAERNSRLAAACGERVVDCRTDHDLRSFATLVDQCEVLVSGDTLAMQIAIARGRHVVALFGPTSPHEIELFGRGEKIVSSAVDCLVCYRRQCDRDPNCMNTIPVEAVHGAVMRQLGLAAAARPRAEPC
ncbi:MAG: glycosyltransferase family 9 protein [Planctomycetes bacterium]|nr:glycosyltransferase family 9 protein [Planctomycetota bacterium]